MASTVSLIAPAAAQSENGVADYIPDSALFYGEFELDQESDQIVTAGELLERANLSELFSVSELTSFTDFGPEIPDPEAFLDGQAGFFLAELPDIEGLSLEEVIPDVSNMPISPDGAVNSDIPEGWAIVVQPSDVEASFLMYSDTLFVDDLPPPVESDYNGYTILTQEPADEYSAGTSLAMVQDVIVIATTPSDIEPVIDTAEGEIEAIANDENYDAVRDELEPDVLMFGYVDGPALLASFNEQEPEALDNSPVDLLSSLGAHQGFVFRADTPGFRFESVALPAEGMDVPEAPAFEPAFATNIPATSLFYAGGSDLGEHPALDALAVLAAQAMLGFDSDMTATPVTDPEAYADQVFADAEAAFGFNLKTDVLDQLVGEWAVAGTVAGITDIEPTISAIFVSEVNDGETVDGVVSTITDMISAEADETLTITSRQVEGSDITVVDMSGSGFPLIVEFGVVDNQLLIGVNEGIDSFVLGEADSLADDSTFRDTLAELPSEYTSVFFLNAQSLLPLIEDAIGFFSMTSVLDNDPACGEYATQEEAQAALDEDDFENWNLDLDFDGEACEDFFAPAATPEAASSGIGDINVLSVGTVTFTDGDVSGTSTIILIGE